MACTILTVTAPPITNAEFKINEFGFAEIEFGNRIFKEPCEEDNIIGSREAIALNFTVSNAKAGNEPTIRFEFHYLRPGETVKSTWVAIFSHMANGTHQKYAYSTDFKYIKGRYEGLTVSAEII